MLGVDVSKATLDCTLRNALTKEILFSLSVPNTEEGIQTLLSKLPSDAPIVAEPTGNYSKPLALLGRAAGRTVLLAPARKTKQFLQSLSSRAKTDKVDSRGRALYGLHGTLSPYPLKEPRIDQYDQTLAARKGVSKAIMNLELQRQSLPLAADSLEGVLSDLKARLQELDAEIARLSKEVPELEVVARLDAVPGIGPVTAAMVGSRLVSKSFSHPDKFVAYCGLDVSVVQSGKRSGQRGLTKQGDAELRRLLYCAAQANLRCKSSPFKEQYARELAKGLSKTGALCAVSRKLAKVCWSLHRYGTEYVAERVSRTVSPAPPPAPTSEENEEALASQ